MWHILASCTWTKNEKIYAHKIRNNWRHFFNAISTNLYNMVTDSTVFPLWVLSFDCHSVPLWNFEALRTRTKQNYMEFGIFKTDKRRKKNEKKTKRNISSFVFVLWIWLSTFFGFLFVFFFFFSTTVCSRVFLSKQNIRISNKCIFFSQRRTYTKPKETRKLELRTEKR